MVDVSVGLSGGRVVALVAEGHAGYSEKGSDVVCAGVSALLQALVYGFENVIRLDGFKCSIDEEEAIMILDWRSSYPQEVSVLVDTLLGSLKEIARVYPEHVRILEVLVDELEF